MVIVTTHATEFTHRGACMGMTVVEKILATATGKALLKAGDVVEPTVDLAMSHENAALVINQFLEIYKGTGVGHEGLGSVEGDHHLRSPRTGRVFQDSDEPEKGARVCSKAHDQQVP